jgi:hypothetical protein
VRFCVDGDEKARKSGVEFSGQAEFFSRLAEIDRFQYPKIGIPVNSSREPGGNS